MKVALYYNITVCSVCISAPNRYFIIYCSKENVFEMYFCWLLHELAIKTPVFGHAS